MVIATATAWRGGGVWGPAPRPLRPPSCAPPAPEGGPPRPQWPAAVDLCTGTGKLAHELLARVQPGGKVIGVDFSLAMLEVARAREPAVRFLQGDVAALPLPDAVAHAVTIAFGYRNLVDRAAGLR